MQPKAKSNSVVTSSYDLASGIITITVLGLGDAGIIKFDARTVSGAASYDGLSENGKRALVHGFLQRLSDRAAIQRDSVTGQSATPGEKFAAIKALADHYAQGGGWELKGGGVAPLNRAALYQAVAAVRGLDAAKVEAVYRAKEDDVLRTLLTIAAIATKYTELTRPVAKDVSDKANEALKELDALSAPAPEEPKNKGFRKPQ